MGVVLNTAFLQASSFDIPVFWMDKDTVVEGVLRKFRIPCGNRINMYTRHDEV